MSTNKTNGFADLGMLAILFGLFVIIVAGALLMWRADRTARQSQKEHSQEVMKINPAVETN